MRWPEGVLTAGLLLAGTTMAAAQPSGPIEVSQPWARATARPGATGGGFMTLKNTGNAPDALTGISCPDAKRAEVHETVRQGDVMRMQPVQSIALPPGQSVSLAPGGYHVMMIGLDHKLSPGDQVTCTLTFQTAPAEQVTFAVERAGAMHGGMQGMPGHMQGMPHSQ